MVTLAKHSVPALLTGVAILAAVRVSTLPPDLLFMLPAAVVLWGGVFAALRKPRGGGSRLRLWVAVPCWCWLLLLALNPFISAWPEMSIWFGMIVALIPASILGLSRILADDSNWNRLEWLIFGAAAFVATMMLYQYFAQGVRANGPFLDANVASAVIYAALLPLMYRMIAARDEHVIRWLLVMLAFGFAAALFTSFSRGGVGSFEIGLLGTALVMMLVWDRAMGTRFIGCLTIFVLAWVLVYHGPVQPHVRTLDNISQDHSFAMRLVMWDAALEIHDDAPLVGTGLGTFSVNYPRYRPLVESGTVGDMAHNDYVQMLAEGGPLLAAFLMAFVLCVLGSALWCLGLIRRAGGSESRRAMVRDMGLFAALLALMVQATVNFIFYVLILSLLAGLYAARLAGRYAMSRRALPAGVAIEGLRQVVRPVCGLLALISLIVVGTGFVSMNALHPGTQEGVDKVSMNNQEYRLALALSYINPLDYRAHFYVARAEAALALGLGAGNLGAGMAVTALKDLNYLLTIKHPDCSVQTIKGRLLNTFETQAGLLRAAGLWQDPVVVLQHVNKVLPTCMPAYVVLAQKWEQKGEFTRAVSALAPALPWLRMAVVKRNDHARVLTMMAKLQAELGKHEKAMALLDEVSIGAPNYEPARVLRGQLRSGEQDESARRD